MPSGTAEQLHCHLKAQQVFYILSGTATFDINGETELVNTNESIHVPPRILHKISNDYVEDLSFIIISEPNAHGDRVEIVEYSEELKSNIKVLNEEWLNKYFEVEPNDTIQLSDPKGEIINKGGVIFYARYNNNIVGTASLLKISNEYYELGKMAVTESAQGIGIGNILMDHTMHLVKKLGVKQLVLYSNTGLAPALNLYRKYGFAEVSMEPNNYKRANIKMQKTL